MSKTTRRSRVDVMKMLISEIKGDGPSIAGSIDVRLLIKVMREESRRASPVPRVVKNTLLFFKNLVNSLFRDGDDFTTEIYPVWDELTGGVF